MIAMACSPSGRSTGNPVLRTRARRLLKVAGNRWIGRLRRVLASALVLGFPAMIVAGTVPSTDGPVDPFADQRRPSPGGTTYHIDPVAGDDQHAGLARDSAWKSFHHINRLTLAAGDRVEIAAPGPFDQTLALAGAGTAANPVEVRFAPGRYDFHPANSSRQTYQISNTNDDPEGGKAVAILLAGARHLRVSGPGATVVCRGRMIEVCVDGCEDITVSGLSFDYHRPTVSEFRAGAAGDGHIDLAIHEHSQYSISNGKITWLGEGWSKTTGLAQELDLESGIVRRRRDPLAGLSLEEIRPFLVRARGPHDMKPGRVYQIRDTRRDCAGVFTRHSRDITWRNVNFRFMHGMGLVHQFSENLTFDSVAIAPDPAGGRTTAAWADCLHLSGCKGRVRVLNSVFSGAHDDAINIHGTYLRFAGRTSDREIRVRFMHPQTFGFMAFHPGDAIEFLHSDTMATYASNRVAAARMENPKDLILTLENALPDNIGDNDVIENITWTPEVEIRGCRVSHIPTRGFLLTTRGKVLVENNEFLATHMSAIQIDADAASWFESGCVRDLAIRRNRFIRCGDPVIDIHPRNSAPNPSFHRNLRIEHNEFVLRGGHAVRAKSTKGLRVTGNSIRSGQQSAGEFVITTDCSDVFINNNRMLPRENR